MTPLAEQEGRPRMAALHGLLTRRPVTAAALITAAFIAIGAVIGVLAKVVVPPISQLPDFIAQGGLIVALVALVTALGWWRAVGFNGPRAWRDWRLLWLPATGALVLWIVGYALTGFYEETLVRGVILRILRPRGPVQAVLISAALFGLLHVTNMLFRNPFIVLAQMVGAAEGVGLAALRLRTNTLWFVIAIHAVEDLTLKLGALPAIPVNVVQSTIMLAYGLYLLRGLGGSNRAAVDTGRPQPA